MGAVGLVAMALIVPVDVWRRSWKVVYGATLALMVLVFVAAEAVRGSKRWLDLGVIQFQPSELGKVLFVLAIAGFVVERVGPTTRWRTILVGDRARRGPDPAGVHAARPRDGARVRGVALRRPLLRRASAGGSSRSCSPLGVLAIVSVLWLLPAAGVQVLKPYQAARLTLDPDADPGGLT